MRTSTVVSSAAAFLAALAPCAALSAQAPAGIRAATVEAGPLSRRDAATTTTFAAAAEIAPRRMPGAFRIGLSTWRADAGGDALQARDLTVLWRLRSRPLGGAGLHTFTGVGPGLSALRPTGKGAPWTIRAAAAAEIGLDLPMAGGEGVALEVRGLALQPFGAPAQLSLRVGLRVAPGGATAHRPPDLEALAGALADAQPAPALPELDDSALAAAGLSRGGAGPAQLLLEPRAFQPGAATLTRQAGRTIADAGRGLRAAGAARVRVVIYSVEGEGPRDLASRRAAAVARALARGGLQPARILLEVALPGTSGDAGSIAAVALRQ